MRIWSLTSGATVELDGRIVGTTPLAESLAVEEGEHTIRVHRQGWTEHVDTFRAIARNEVVLEIDLIPLPQDNSPPPAPGQVMKVPYEQKTLDLLEATEKLMNLRDAVDEHWRRLSIICVDYFGHEVCAEQRAASFADLAYDYDPTTRAAAEVTETTQKLTSLRADRSEQTRRLSIICVDYPEHEVCAEQTAARYARDAFCGDTEFTEHVNGLVSACQGDACKQVDEAKLITRSDYMLLLSRLPGTLVLFRANDTRLDRKDTKQLQTFLENVQGEKGYLIIVGRASRDGKWEKNLQLALDRAETTRQYVVDRLGVDGDRVGYITYGHPKMYLTELDAERMREGRLSVKQANRGAYIFSYPCYDVDGY